MNKHEKCIFGVDPGTIITGFGIIQINEKNFFSVIDYGCIRPPSSYPLPQRYRIIYESIVELIEKYKPDDIVIETQYIHKNPQSGIKLGMARGMAVLAAALKEIPIFEYAPARAKCAVTGSGRASKEKMQKMVQNILRLPFTPAPPDAADALALAICHGYSHLKLNQPYTKLKNGA